jgi:hypothetical protein
MTLSSEKSIISALFLRKPWGIKIYNFPLKVHFTDFKKDSSKLPTDSPSQ